MQSWCAPSQHAHNWKQNVNAPPYPQKITYFMFTIRYRPEWKYKHKMPYMGVQ